MADFLLYLHAKRGIILYGSYTDNLTSINNATKYEHYEGNGKISVQPDIRNFIHRKR